MWGNAPKSPSRLWEGLGVGELPSSPNSRPLPLPQAGGEQ
jgi:hypothetical protein